MRQVFLCLALILASVVAAKGPAHAASDPMAFDPDAAIRFSQAAIGRDVGNPTFLDRRGRPVRLADFRGKPMVVNLVYTACSQSCPVIVQTLYRAVEVAQDALGAERFAVLTIGFETDSDTPARMQAFAASQGVNLPNWYFLSTDETTIKQLSDRLGFIYFPSPKGFDHLAQTSVLDRDGRVYRQVYGADFEPPAVVEPLKDLVFGRQVPITSLAGLVDRVRLFCTLYDPASERYRFDYSIFIALAIGGLSLLGIAAFLLRSWFAAPGGPGPTAA